MDLSPGPDIVVYVLPRILRERFNDSQILAMVQREELTVEYVRNAHLQRPELVGEPACTHSQIIHYLDREGSFLATVHQYLRSDGSLGASGRPDPKRMRVGNEIWIAEQ